MSVTSYHKENDFNPTQEDSPSFVNKDMNKKIYSSKDITFKPTQSGSVRDSLLFSREALSEDSYIKEEEISPVESIKSVGNIKNVFQVFNKYIVIEFEDDVLWMVDQHAAAERVTFEKLKNQGDSADRQNLLVPNTLKFSLKEISALEELKEFFSSLGFEYTVKKDSIDITVVPVEFVESDYKKLFDEIFALSDDVKDISKELNRLREDILATMSCHTSVRSGQYLHREEMLDLIKKLMNCENPYSCPHGRPAVWKLKLSDIDSNFERTY